MYSVVLMMALSGSADVPQGILFGRGGCGGRAVAGLSIHPFQHFRERRQARRDARGSGCGGGGVASYGGCGGGSASSSYTSTYKVKREMRIEQPEGAKKMPLGSPAPQKQSIKPLNLVDRPGGQAVQRWERSAGCSEADRKWSEHSLPGPR